MSMKVQSNKPQTALKTNETGAGAVGPPAKAEAPKAQTSPAVKTTSEYTSATKGPQQGPAASASPPRPQRSGAGVPFGKTEQQAVGNKAVDGVGARPNAETAEKVEQGAQKVQELQDKIERLEAQKAQAAAGYAGVLVPGAGWLEAGEAYLERRALDKQIDETKTELAETRQKMVETFQSDPAGTLSGLRDRGTLNDVQKALLTPPSKENTAVLSEMGKSLSGNPTEASIFMNQLAKSVSRAAGRDKVLKAFGDGLKVGGEVGGDKGKVTAEWDPKPMIDALRENDRQELAEAFQAVQGSVYGHYDREWGGDSSSSPQWQEFNREMEKWVQREATNRG